MGGSTRGLFSNQPRPPHHDLRLHHIPRSAHPTTASLNTINSNLLNSTTKSTSTRRDNSRLPHHSPPPSLPNPLRNHLRSAQRGPILRSTAALQSLHAPHPATGPISLRAVSRIVHPRSRLKIPPSSELHQPHTSHKGRRTRVPSALHSTISSSLTWAPNLLERNWSARHHAPKSEPFDSSTRRSLGRGD